jgi:hypothetical protein
MGVRTVRAFLKVPLNKIFNRHRTPAIVSIFFLLSALVSPVKAITLNQVRSYIYAIAAGPGTPGLYASVKNSPIDLVILGGGSHATRLDRTAIDPSNSKLVFNYIDLTEAATFYAPSLFSNGTRSPILGRPTPGFSDLYSVQYWDPVWRAEVHRQIDLIIGAGYDGVFLDVVTPDAWVAGNLYGNPIRATALSDLSSLVDDVASYVKAKNLSRPFYLIANNPLALAKAIPSSLSNFDAIFHEWVYWGQPTENGLTSVYKGTQVAQDVINSVSAIYKNKLVLGDDYPLPLDSNTEVFRSFSLYNSIGWVPSVTKALQDEKIFESGPFLFLATPSNQSVAGAKSFVNFIGGGLATATTLSGGDKDDFFIGGPGTNAISAGGGNDTVYAHPENVVNINLLEISFQGDVKNVPAPSFSILINGKIAIAGTQLTGTTTNQQIQTVKIDTTPYGEVNTIEIEAIGTKNVDQNTFSNIFIEGMFYQGQRIDFTKAQFGKFNQSLTNGTRALLNGNNVVVTSPILPITLPSFGSTSDIIDGGTGVNTVVYRRASANYSVTNQADGTVLVASTAPGEGPDTLKNIQSLQFTDKTVSISSGAPLRDGAVFSTAQSTSQSFLRFFNTSATPGTVTAVLSDYASGQRLGQWTSPSLPAGASRQFSIDDVEQGTGASFTKPLNYTASFQPQFINGYFQHVLWRPADGTLTNLSTCDAGVTAIPTSLINVHSSILDFGYPSTVVVNNAGTVSASATLSVYDSVTGSGLAPYTTSLIPPGGQARIPIATIEAAAKINPGTSIYHYNITLAAGFTGFLQHLITNRQAGVITDMTTVCSFGAVSATPSATPRVPSVFSTTQSATQSFIRLYNTGTAAGTAKLSLLSDATGASLAQWSSPSIAAGASKQFSIDEIEKGTGTTFTKSNNYTISIQPSMSGFVQHVLYRPADGTLTNASTCDAGVTANATQLINVHSTILDYGFPSTVVVANTGSTATSVTLGVYDSTNGAKLGTYTTASIPANGQLNLAIATIEKDANVSPGTTIYQYNIKAESAFTGFLQHLVTNKQAGVITDMTTVCRLN